VLETLHGADKKDETRIKRAFKWIITFRDFPEGCWQTVDGDSMMTEALTLFTKGRAQFELDGVLRKDRVPGVLSSEHEVVGQGGEFKITYVEPTTRICIPAKINDGKLPTVTKHELKEGEMQTMHGAFLVCLGSVEVNGKEFTEEKTFRTSEPREVLALHDVILLEFHD
jgi:hypothetical protein